VSEIINKLGLSTVEEKVYLHLLATGQLAIPEIAKKIGHSLQEVETALNSLMEKNLIFTNPSIIKKYSAVYPLSSLAEKAHNSLENIQQIGDEINSFSKQKMEVLEQVVRNQKDNMQTIASNVREENRISTEQVGNQIEQDIDSLVEEISQILNQEKNNLTNLSLNTLNNLSKFFQETNEKSGNIISSAVSNISNSLTDSGNTISKSFENASQKVEDASATMENSLHASLDNNFKDYHKTTNDVQEKIRIAIEDYNKAAKDNIKLNSDNLHENFDDIVKTVGTRLGLYDNESKQILDERIRNITDSMSEMNDEINKVIRDKISAVRRDYLEMMESFKRNVETMFTDAVSQLEALVAAKTKTNADKLDGLLNLMKTNLEKSATEARNEIKGKEVKITNDLRTSEQTTQRKMTEIYDKLNMELINQFNKTTSDFESSKNNMNMLVTRAKTDINTRFEEAAQNAQNSISTEFKEQEGAFTNIGSEVVDEIRTLIDSAESESKKFIKETEERAKSAIAKIEMPSKTILNKGKQATVKQVNNLSSQVNKTIEKTQSNIEDSIISETAKITTTFQGYGDKFKQNSKEIEKLLADLELTYRELLTKVKDVPKVDTRTTTLIGKEAVLDQMEKILGKVKSTVTCVYPEIGEIPVNVLLESNPRTRIIVIGDFDPFKHADIIKRLMSKENIQLKSLTIDATTRPYYAIGRDVEEGLIASIDESGEIVGVVSSSSSFVDLISNEVINSVITPKTKRVVIPEEQ
jgi:sugar-specific transcriptional regulator TrmB